MSYKPNYDELIKSYNDALNVLSGGKYTPLRRKSDVTQTSTFDKSVNSGYNVNAELKMQNAKWDKPSYGNSQTMPSLPTTERGGRIPLDSTYGGIQNVKSYTPSYEYKPSYGGKTNGTMRASSPATSVWRKDFETPAPAAPQTQSYRPGEGFITKPENQILSAGERENIKITQLPYKPDEHGGEYVQYNNTFPNFNLKVPGVEIQPGYNYDFSPIINEAIEVSKRSEFKSRKDKRHGSENRQPSGSRERNVGHPEGEEHSRVPKGNNNRKNGVYRNEQDFWDDAAKGIITILAVAAGVCWFCYTGDPSRIYAF